MKTYDLVEELKFRKNYEDFSDFMEECRDRIYRRFLMVFEEMHRAGMKEGSLIVYATIEEVTFDSTLRISASDTSMLTDVILEYYKEKEEYEVCAKILKVCSDLKKR